MITKSNRAINFCCTHPGYTGIPDNTMNGCHCNGSQGFHCSEDICVFLLTFITSLEFVDLMRPHVFKSSKQYRCFIISSSTQFFFALRGHWFLFLSKQQKEVISKGYDWLQWIANQDDCLVILMSLLNVFVWSQSSQRCASSVRNNISKEKRKHLALTSMKIDENRCKCSHSLAGTWKRLLCQIKNDSITTVCFQKQDHMSPSLWDAFHACIELKIN